MYLSFDPLLRFISSKNDQHELNSVVEDYLYRFGVTYRSWHRYMRQGQIPFSAADKIAIALGYHPIEIWGDEYFNPAPKGELLNAYTRA